MTEQKRQDIQSLLEEFFWNGIVVLPATSAEHKTRWLRCASKAIDDHIDPAAPKRWQNFSEVSIQFPTYGCVGELINRLISNDCRELDVGQLSTVLPGYPTNVDGPADWLKENIGRHIDGGRTQQSNAWFSVIVGVLATPIDSNNAGNLAYWPRSHFLSDYLAQSGKNMLLGDQELSVPDVRMMRFAGEPEQVVGPAGTVFIMHHALQHGIAPHTGNDQRSIFYYRIASSNVERHMVGRLWWGFNDFLPSTQIGSSACWTES